MKKRLAVLIAGLVSISCSALMVNSDRVVVTISDQTKVRIEPLSEKILRVSAVPAGEKFSKRPSLMRSPEDLPSVPFECTEDESFVTVKTESVIARVDRRTGEVVFLDMEGNIILQENQGGGKSFSPKIGRASCRERVYSNV